MGSTIDAYIEYDRTLLCQPSATDIMPFAEVPEAIDLTNFTLFRGGKDYAFFGAISGIRNPTDKLPLYPLRGVPSRLSSEAQHGLALEDPCCLGWLTLREIEEAITHMGLTHEDLSLETNVVLTMMAYLEGQLGRDRVRLVFAIE